MFLFITEVILATEDGRLQIHMLPPKEDHEPSFTLPHLHMKVQSPLLKLKKKETLQLTLSQRAPPVSNTLKMTLQLNTVSANQKLSGKHNFLKIS